MPPINSLVGVDWLNANALRSFPLSDEASTKDVTSSITLPEDFLVDLILPVSYASGRTPGSFHLMEVGVFGQGVTIKIGYGGVWDTGTQDWSTAPIEVCKVSVSASHTPNSSYFMYGTGDFSDTIGKITIGVLDSILQFGGLYKFDLAGGRLIATCIRPDIRGVTSLRVRNGNDLSDALYGDITLEASQGMKIEVDGSTIVFSGFGEDELNVGCGCADEADRSLPPPIRTINTTVAPNTDGNVNITTSRCLEITNQTNGLLIDDTCSDPCCTSEELKKILDDQLQLSKDIRQEFLTQQQLDNRLNQLESLVSAIQATGFIIT